MPDDRLQELIRSYADSKGLMLIERSGPTG
jgi:hypothetical protein